MVACTHILLGELSARYRRNQVMEGCIPRCNTPRQLVCLCIGKEFLPECLRPRDLGRGTTLLRQGRCQGRRDVRGLKTGTLSLPLLIVHRCCLLVFVFANMP